MKTKTLKKIIFNSKEEKRLDSINRGQEKKEKIKNQEIKESKYFDDGLLIY